MPSPGTVLQLRTLYIGLFPNIKSKYDSELKCLVFRGVGYPALWPSPNCRQPLDVSNEFTFKLIDGILKGIVSTVWCNYSSLVLKHYNQLNNVCPYSVFQISVRSSSTNLFTWEAMKWILVRFNWFTSVIFWLLVQRLFSLERISFFKSMYLCWLQVAGRRLLMCASGRNRELQFSSLTYTFPETLFLLATVLCVLQVAEKPAEWFQGLRAFRVESTKDSSITWLRHHKLVRHFKWIILIFELPSFRQTC